MGLVCFLQPADVLVKGLIASNHDENFKRWYCTRVGWGGGMGVGGGVWWRRGGGGGVGEAGGCYRRYENTGHFSTGNFEPF